WPCSGRPVTPIPLPRLVQQKAQVTTAGSEVFAVFHNQGEVGNQLGHKVPRLPEQDRSFLLSAQARLDDADAMGGGSEPLPRRLVAAGFLQQLAVILQGGRQELLLFVGENLLLCQRFAGDFRRHGGERGGGVVARGFRALALRALGLPRFVRTVPFLARLPRL